jgi:wyosine [tRNA(Phe)-imidazoG37] synthetase (radical SAM superfamily)
MMQSFDKQRIFGPVPSRRLGKSIGINNIPHKFCSYSCVYCQVGKSIKQFSRRKEFFDPIEIFEKTKQHLADLKKEELPDYITIVPDGEPTLDIQLGTLIKYLKRLGYPVAVITNGTLLNEPSVQDDLKNADFVSIKMDAANSAIWEKINQPAKGILLDTIINSAIQFSNDFSGKLVTETMLLKGFNDTENEIRSIAGQIKILNPDIAYLAIPTRPTAFKNILPASEKTIAMAYHIFSEMNIRTELLIGYEGNTFTSTGDFSRDILSITAVHPLRKDAVMDLMEKTGASEKDLEQLLSSGQIKLTRFNMQEFIVRSFIRHSE